MVAADQTTHVTLDRPSVLPPNWASAGFGVYVHWPFCRAKCPYCDFNSHVQREVDQTAFARALVAEAGHMRALTGPRAVDTVFFGGGTPSLMEAGTVGHVLSAIDRLWGIAAGAEISLEANPTSVEAGRFRGYAAAGVNRVSMGVQALNDADLKALGRQHSVAEAEAAFDVARSVFDRVSFDLIYARMGQSVADWEAELSHAIAMSVDHVSLYQLTIEQGTRFAELYARGRLHVPGDVPAAEMYAVTQQICEAAGMPGYEISNHARPGAESRHNLIYWRYGDYAGIGPGAHGRITRDAGRRAISTRRDPSDWLAQVASAGHGIEASETLLGPDQATEYLMMGLRLTEGIDLARFARMGGQINQGRRDDLERMGLIARSADRLTATRDGRIVLNSLIGELLS